MGCERVPPEQLYGKRFSDEIKECITSAQFPRPSRETCDISENKLAVDYACRYRLEKQTKSGFVRPLLRRCYCCGFLYSYVEYGSICTAYCSSEIEKKEKQDWMQSSLSHSIGVMFVQNMSQIIMGMKLIWESVLME